MPTDPANRATALTPSLFRGWWRSFAALIPFVASNFVAAQSVYSGSYTFNDSIVGQATYGYRISKGDTVFNGPWRFQATWPDPTDKELLHAIEISGNYNQQGVKDGPWSYSRKEIKSTDGPRLEGFRLVTDASGTHHRIDGTFTAGKATGAWRTAGRRIVEALEEDTLYHVFAEMNGGAIAGKVEGLWNGSAFSGSTNERSMLHGVWRTDHPLADGRVLREERSYEDGLLIQHGYTLDNRSHSLRHVGLGTGTGSGDRVIMDVGGLYFRILEATSATPMPDATIGRTPMADSTRQRVAASNSTLDAALSSFTEHLGIRPWEALPGSVAMGTALVRVVKYPFSPNEKQALASAQEMLQESRSIIRKTIDDPQVEIGRHAHREVAKYQAVLHIHDQHLERLAGSLTIAFDPAFEYMDRSAVMPFLTPDLQYPDSVLYLFKGSSYRVPYEFPKAPNGAPDGLGPLEAHLKNTLRDLRKIRDQVDVLLDRDRLESQLSEKEERLLQQRDTVIDLYTNKSQRTDQNDFHRAVAEPLITLIANGFEDYAALDAQDKSEAIDSLLACSKEAIEGYSTLARLPLRLQRLDELYTRTVWNPYTFTHMDERMKDRVYEAFHEVVLPHLLQKLSTELRCGRIEGLLRNFTIVHLRMVELREQDTKVLERSLRKESDVSVILPLLGIQLAQ